MLHESDSGPCTWPGTLAGAADKVGPKVWPIRDKDKYMLSDKDGPVPCMLLGIVTRIKEIGEEIRQECTV
jgi:hypothetical protein